MPNPTPRPIRFAASSVAFVLNGVDVELATELEDVEASGTEVVGGVFEMEEEVAAALVMEVAVIDASLMLK